MNDMFDKWDNKEFPKDIQDAIDGFANAEINSETSRIIFRAGFYIGLNIKDIRQKIGLNDREKKSFRFYLIDFSDGNFQISISFFFNKSLDKLDKLV